MNGRTPTRTAVLQAAIAQHACMCLHVLACACMQVVPHITDAIQDWIQKVAHTPVDGKPGPPDVCVIELGGTVGDIESMPFVEALRQFQVRLIYCCEAG